MTDVTQRTVERGEVETRAEFDAALEELVAAAAANGVEVEGSHPVLVDGEDRGWDVEVVALARE